MVRWFAIIALILTSCAQVGTITGGPADQAAPQVLSQSIFNEQCNVTAHAQQLVFDEYIKLDQAQQRITLMPSDSRLQFNVKGKALTIDFLDALQPNTTYTLTSNGGIKDLTEGNDSLMTWTFSTGPQLDSLQIWAKASELKPSTKQATISLGLFDTDTSASARYVSRFDAKGNLHLKGLKAGKYYFKAYIDDNQDGVCGSTERQDHFFEAYELATLQADTLLFHLSEPVNPKDTSKVSAPAVQKKDTLTTLKQYSSLVIELDTLLSPLLLEIYQAEQCIKRQTVSEKKIRIDSLNAGMYSLHFVLDQNQNLKWDPIDLQQKKRAETLFIYPEKIKLRPNWELELPVNNLAKSLFKN